MKKPYPTTLSRMNPPIKRVYYSKTFSEAILDSNFPMPKNMKKIPEIFFCEKCHLIKTHLDFFEFSKKIKKSS